MPKQGMIRPGLDIAIIGMAGRFPGAENLQQFWDNLKKGVESISFFTDEELRRAGEELPDFLDMPNYVRAKGIIKNIEYFDADFFGYNAREADFMDPQIRVLHECVWQALEQAGYDPQSYKGAIGMYAGASNNLYWEVKTYYFGGGGGLARTSLSDKDHLSTRISYKFNLRGPSFTIETQCSTSLLAVHLACQGLLSGECDMALAGGVSVSLPNKSGYLYEEGSLYSADGHCRAFDTEASGTVFSNGAGIVLLKRAEDAINHGDHIFALIKGSAINNDGNRKVGYTAPSVEGQVEAIKTALQMAQAEPESISYIETHGTGTNLGDPIELEGLKLALNTQKKQFCRIGSVKTNIGHTDNASGIASLIKAVLAIQHRQLPPSLHFRIANPKIDFENSPFVMNTELVEWRPNGYPLRAGVSSFGVGGTNTHVVLEEAPEVEESSPSREWQLLTLSARTETALENLSTQLTEYLASSTEKLADIAYTLQVGRRAFSNRRVLVCRSHEEAIAALQSGSGSINGIAKDQPKPVTFMFSGQGSQYVNMGRGLYEREEVFRTVLDQCFGILAQHSQIDFKTILYPAKEIESSRIDETEVTQPLLFVLEYGITKLLEHWGIRPDAMIGHSIGEYVAATVSGVLSLEQALRLVALRGRLMQECPRGSMLSVRMDEDAVLELLGECLWLAAVNSSGLCVISGEENALADLMVKLQERGVWCKRLRTSHAFHSELMEVMLPAFAEGLRDVDFGEPTIPYISNVTGTWITEEMARDPQYWLRQIREPVRFSLGLDELLKDENRILIEVGAGQALSIFARQHCKFAAGHDVMQALRGATEAISDDYYLLQNLARLWTNGINVDWSGFYSSERRRRVPLPTYPFERKRYWIEGNPISILTNKFGEKPQPREVASDGVFYHVPIWQKVELPAATESQKQSWIIFLDELGIGRALCSRLKEAGHTVVTVKPGKALKKKADDSYVINPGRDDSYEPVLADFLKRDKLPKQILHLWNVAEPTSQYNPDAIEKSQDLGFYSLINIAKVIGKYQAESKIQIKVLTSNIQKIADENVSAPWRATVFGAIKIIPLEYPNISAASVDFLLNPLENGNTDHLLDLLFKEIIAGSSEQFIAYRSDQRYVQRFEAISMDSPAPSKPPLREQGVYLITGGLGGIGLELAKMLGANLKAKLILTSRSQFPPKEEWHKQNGDVKLGSIIPILNAVEKSGAEVLVFTADIADQEQMQSVVNAARERFGAINGVIHCAGVPGGELVQALTREKTESVMAPKLKGTLILDQLLQNEKLDFFMVCSSIFSVIGSIGEASYCAANAFLDAFAHYKNQQGDCYAFSANWDTWREVGMAVKAAQNLLLRSAKPTSHLQEIPHPLFQGYLSEEPESRTYISSLAVDKHWVLSEHMILKTPTLPGTAYLEIATAAVRNFANIATLELHDVYFLKPAVFETAREKEIRTIVKKSKAGYEFTVQSFSDHEQTWEIHCNGKASVAKEAVAEMVNLKEIEFVCSAREIEDDIRNPKYLVKEFTQLGLRWANLKKIRLGADEGLASLELLDEYVNDLDSYQVHPALMDMAAGFYIPFIDDRGGYYPFLYKRLRVMGPLPQRIFSYAKFRKDKSTRESMVFDLVITNPEGRKLLEVEGYTVKKAHKQSNVAPQSSIPVSENTALIISSLGNFDSLQYQPATRTKPGPGEVEIEVYATGINFKEVLIALGIIPAPGNPFAFGFECSGRIVACGDRVTDFSVGNDVIAMGKSCFSRYVTLPAAFVAPKPNNVSIVEAATLPIAYLTAYYALIKMGRLGKGEKVLIHSATGGVGMAAVQIAKWVGAEIFATAGNPQKREYLQSLGIKHVMDSRSLNFADEVMTLTNNEGVDVLLNSLAGEFIPKGLSIMATNGRFLEIGIRDIYENSKLGLRPFEKGLSFIAINEIKGIGNVKSMLLEIVEHINQGNLSFIPYKEFKIDDVTNAFKYMAQTRHIGKIVVTHKDTAFLARNSQPTKDKTSPQNGILQQGLLSSQGTEAFRKILSLPAESRPSQIAVSAQNRFSDEGKHEEVNLLQALKSAKKGASSQAVRPRPELSTKYVAPENETEKAIAKIWRDYLRIEKIGVNDNFFELGASSLDLVQINSELKQEFAMDIPVAIMFENPTINSFTNQIKHMLSGDEQDDGVQERVEKIQQGRKLLQKKLEKQTSKG